MNRNNLNWNFINHPKFGFMNSLSDSIVRGVEKNLHFLPDLQKGSTIFVGSDYGGEHSSLTHYSMAFIFVDIEQCESWLSIHREIRNKFLPDGRRISYKSLGDKLKQGFLQPFLNSANQIQGVIFLLLVNKQITTLFEDFENIRNDPLLKQYSHWKLGVLEKALRAINFVSFFLSGLSRPNQDILWITDEDDIVANEDRLLEFIEIYKNVSSNYLNHDLRHFRCGTTKVDSGNRQIEDLVSIPDLTCGVLTELISEYQKSGIQPSIKSIVPPPTNLKEKSLNFMNWFADERHPLKRIVFQIDRDESSNKLLLKRLKFHSISAF